ncbi:sugar ABC transporter substrate-binding protein [Solirubrobacter ginsenosidimutans]|uniref:Sugar ABC transporter substrate-binding protein n=1 Tax=Solirubrobacter ginsenosidimutans TaxID=490573 RepID=A0A9X3N1G1_9ACTN|nr:sugar ABC transporter substrate-binding protein [Solirubrobacter ginsenosidimutans]MDA0166615.1 sugar ABC transporter substrate-binding protein [Solirubrobacter ginsenosidimutans]
MKRLLIIVALLAAGCGSSSTGARTADGKVLLRYQLWDTNQKPVYQKCADKFEQANPNIKIQIENKNWGDYWSGLARGFIADTAPDVFTDHLGKYPQFAQSEVIETVSTRAVNMDQYLPGLAKLWQSPDGRQYGLPKDWDTVALIVNEDMLTKAGLTKAQLDSATWNPSDGGSFEQMVAKLSVDNNGKRGDQPGFDPSNVKVYGLAFDPGGLTYGQTTWAGFAASLGFKLLDKNPWGTKYNYADPAFAQTFTWWRDMIHKGFMPSLEQARTLGQSAAFQSGKAALAIDGDWTIGTYSATKGVKVGYSPQPAGPKGSWSMYNGLADAIWVGSKHKPEARKWVDFLASKDCQSIVGTEAVVFPAIKSEIPKAVAKHEKDGIDVSAFTSYIDSGNTVLYPITDKAPQINLIVQPTLEEFLNGNDDAATVFKKMNSQVNNQLKYAK